MGRAGSGPSTFDGIGSLEEGLYRCSVGRWSNLSMFVVISGGYKAVTLSLPFCALLANTLMAIALCKASEEERDRLKAKSSEERLQLGIRAIERYGHDATT